MKSRTAAMTFVLVLTCAFSNPLSAIDKDNYTGSCEDLAKYIKNVGVRNSKGNHATHPGVTHSEVEAGDYNYDIVKRSVKSQFYCAANSTYYDTIEKCQKPPSQGGCRTVLGTIPCVPKSDQVCLDADVTITFPGTHTVTRLNWATPGKSTACKKDVDRWYKAIETHESRHVKDGKALVLKWNKDYKKKRLSVCGQTEPEAKEKLLATISSMGSKALDELKTAIDKAGKDFHATPAGASVPSPSCTICN